MYLYYGVEAIRCHCPKAKLGRPGNRIIGTGPVVGPVRRLAAIGYISPAGAAALHLRQRTEQVAKG